MVVGHARARLAPQRIGHHASGFKVVDRSGTPAWERRHILKHRDIVIPWNRSVQEWIARTASKAIESSHPRIDRAANIAHRNADAIVFGAFLGRTVEPRRIVVVTIRIHRTSGKLSKSVQARIWHGE